jgi:hypothetical protein
MGSFKDVSSTPSTMLIGVTECVDKVNFAHIFYGSFQIKFKKMKPSLWRGSGHVEDEFNQHFSGHN